MFWCEIMHNLNIVIDDEAYEVLERFQKNNPDLVPGKKRPSYNDCISAILIKYKDVIK